MKLKAVYRSNKDKAQLSIQLRHYKKDVTKGEIQLHFKTKFIVSKKEYDKGIATLIKAVKTEKDLEKEQKSRQTRAIRDSIDNSLLDIATLYRDVMLLQSGSTDFLINTDLLSEVQKIAESTTPELTVKKIESIMHARINLSHNAAPLLTLEALMCSLK